MLHGFFTTSTVSKQVGDASTLKYTPRMLTCEDASRGSARRGGEGLLCVTLLELLDARDTRKIGLGRDGLGQRDKRLHRLALHFLNQHSKVTWSCY